MIMGGIYEIAVRFLVFILVFAFAFVFSSYLIMSIANNGMLCYNIWVYL